jgi:HTH-type transcriptional regulator, glycine betaine synthesis regulator
MARKATSTAELLNPARDLGIDTCGRIAEFWGFTRTMGRTFGLLYFSQQPLSQSQIQSRLRVSAGSASMTLTALGRWGVAHRVWVPGQRREHYQAETDFWKMISGVLNERERREIGAAVEVLARARGAVAAVRATIVKARSGDGARAEAAFIAERLDRLNDICLLGQTLLDMLLGQLKLDVSQFRDVLRVAPVPAADAPPGHLDTATRSPVPPADERRRAPRPGSAPPSKSRSQPHIARTAKTRAPAAGASKTRRK